MDGCWSASESENEDETLISDDNGPNIDISNMNSTCTRFLLTNARSLEPKTTSLIEAFDSLNLHFAGVTET